MSNVNTYDRESSILIVDDDDTLLKFYKIHLNKFFSKITVVPSAKAAVEVVEKNPIDLILTDVKMPRTTGVQLLKKIKRINSAIPVIMVSGALLNEKQQETVDECADGYVKKPFDVDELHSAIKKGLEQREGLKFLGEVITPNKNLRDVIQGKSKAKKFVDDVEALAKVEALLSEMNLKKSA